MVYRGRLFGATSIADGVMNLIAVSPTLRKGTLALSVGGSAMFRPRPIPPKITNGYQPNTPEIQGSEGLKPPPAPRIPPVARNVSLRRELILALSPVLAARQDWVSNDDLAEKITSLVDKILHKADV